MARPRIYGSHFFAKLTDKEREILKIIGNGNEHEGLRQSIIWSAHFHNIGLESDMNLDHIGLITTSDNEHWHE